ncbi:MAG TPA: aminopeptidase P family N-terminal domain-containing protein, partial [bacterium]|nr:aminopeptidase P family N-terminal domain-containing protein [bacterium]
MAVTLPSSSTLVPDFAGRVARLRDRLPELGLDALLVTDKSNRRYLSGFTGSAGVLLVTPEEQLLSTDSRYYTQAEMECPTFELVRAGYGYVPALAERLDLNGKRIGVEKENVTLDLYEKLQEAVPG